MMRSTIVTLIVAGSVAAQPPAKEDVAHEQLRMLRKEMVDAVNAGDVERLLTHLDDDVVVTFMDSQVCRKPAGVRAYLDRMLKGETRVVKEFHCEPTVDELTHLYGDTGVAFGSSKDAYSLTDGREFLATTRWTGTLVRKGDRWKVASFHASESVFNNPILDLAKRALYWTGGVAGVVGLLAGVVVGRVTKRR